MTSKIKLKIGNCFSHSNAGLVFEQLRLKSQLLFFITALFSCIFTVNAHAKKQIQIVAFGDSLTAGYQLPPSASFPAQLEKTLKTKGYDIKITNAGVSGDTTNGGLARFDWAIPDNTDIVILELGANDALRGISPEQTKQNLDKTLHKLRSKGIIILLAGMKAPGSLGEEYTKAFDQIYPDLAKKYNISLYPFFLEGVALRPKLNLSDGIHPNREGVAIIVKNILPHIEALIKQVDAQK